MGEAERPTPADEPSRRFRLIAADKQARDLPFSIEAARPGRDAAAGRVAGALQDNDRAPTTNSRTHAWYWIDSHPSHVAFTLPERASWVRGRGSTAGRPIRLNSTPSPPRVINWDFPPIRGPGPVLVEVEYQLSKAHSGTRAASPPGCSTGAVALETLWEVHILCTLPLSGCPRGGPTRTNGTGHLCMETEARGDPSRGWWPGLPAPPAQAPEALREWATTNGGDMHEYLFGRAGQPIPLKPWVASRAWIVGLCSGIVLLLGFSLMFTRVRFREVWAGRRPRSACSASPFAHPSSVLADCPVVAQRPGPCAAGPPRSRGCSGDRGPSTPAATADRLRLKPFGRVCPRHRAPAGVGSDDSTAIRVRVSSTMDHVASPLVLNAEQPSVRGSSFGPSG